ncbi:hypothetical protein N0V88_007243 [Collariella sp. IMI 366227]|nr:hypothetical protein N0V88_007243 [Collariella sp. IMI 366227]
MGFKTGPYDLLIVIDATASMGEFLRSLNNSIQDIIRISATTASFDRIGVLAYRDYCDSKLTEWSGWHSRDDKSEITQAQLLTFANSIRPIGGGDWPEAARTGLALAYQMMRPEAQTIMLLYADAPPHSETNAGNWKSEQDALLKPNSYGGNGQFFADWVSAATTLKHGDKRAQIFSIIEPGLYQTSMSMFTYLSVRTGGICIGFQRKPNPTTISKVTVGLLMAWMGADKEGAKLDTAEIASHIHYVDVSGVEQVASEKDKDGGKYLVSCPGEKAPLKANLARSPLSLNTLAQIVPRREASSENFAKRYKDDPEYKIIVVEQLTAIIESDVSAIALNPVFGTLWRTVCNDRLNPARDTLITRFGSQVDKIQDAEKKERMKSWLEESYDWAGEILGMIKAVPEESRYPCVFLDPTVRFSAAGDDDENGNNSMEFTRDELLEIGRSCDYRILRRLGRILTRLTYVNSKDDLPAHIKDVPEDQVPRIPMALAKSEHDRKFWKVLLHAVLPGTMLAARPAALLAALSVRMGIKPLEEVAYTELFAWRNNWNTLDIPETWNTSCLSLLLEADKKHQKSVADSKVAKGQAVLKPEDRRLFETLVSYKMLEMNMDTTLEAMVGWTPSKSKVPLGPVVVCRKCHFPRSVTIMGEKGVCGMCAVPCTCETKESHEEMVRHGVCKSDDGATMGTWVECAMTSCRAQYVVYHVDKLRVRAKCHYCRQKMAISNIDPGYERLTTAPCVTCTQCSNNIIYPSAYRPVDFNSSTYKCPACTSNSISTITTIETTPRSLAAENTTAFLLRNDDATISAPFTNRSLFHTISSIPTPDTRTTTFPAKIEILPPSPLTLTIRGKPLHNTPALLTALNNWISNRRVQSGTCSLCFSNFPKRNLVLACGGRKGCRQPICTDCAKGWYGLNAPGKIINVAALACPFCRRQPTSRFHGLPEGVRFLSGLQDAVDEKGSWVYAWCEGCESAKRFVERVCARGVPELEGYWRCEGCLVEAEERRAAGWKKKPALVIKKCPACGVPSQKAYGCDHVECICGKHWCYGCAKVWADEAGEIYDHMSKEHHTWRMVGDWEDDEESDWE